MEESVDPDELMDLEEAEGSDLDEDDEESIDDPLPSPFQFPSGPASATTSAASSPLTNEDIPAPYSFSGKPLNLKRGRGRPRREGGKPLPRRQNSGSSRPRKPKPPGFSRNFGSKRVKSFDRGDFDFSSITPSPSEEMSMLDPETGAFIFPEKEKHMPAPEELPYAPEQWPGKVCAFCNLGERSQLGQGDLLRLNCPEGFTPQRVISDQSDNPASGSSPLDRETGDKSPRGPVTCRRQKSFNKCRHPSLTNEYVDELTIIGHVEQPELHTLFEQTGHFFVHRNCALWSNGVIKNENSALENVDTVLLHSSLKKCSHCSRFGASLSCKAEGCPKVFHFPCATAAYSFQELPTLTVLCMQHINLVPTLCDSTVCYTCKMMGDIANLMYCSSCGEHYHGTCVGLAQLPGVRAGWQCRKCRICQVCRMLGDETKLMACEQCDKVYHAMCLRPIVTTIPKYGWKCRCCRVCGDCGSRTPGAGLSSRWHAHYTVCDSCYQQRNKGYSCPLCHRAYRAHAYREMVQCTLCRKFVHGTCDAEADLATYHQRKESHPEYEYVCLNCKNLTQPGRQLLAKRNSVDEATESLSASQESLYDETSEFDFERPPPEEFARFTGLGKGKPYSASKIAKKRLGLTTSARPKGVGKVIPEKLGFMKRQRLTEFGRKRGTKSKMRGIFGVPGVGLQRPVSDGSKADDEPGVENKLILCSAKDKYILTQDVCVMCGALGTDQEGCLIACIQCGQCYHPYCVNVKVTKVILQKGWRCLDCTVCEGCGQRNDEGRLILCDDCDISYHIYCMDPPLDYVPHGNWKCKWCAICQSCGATDPGFNCSWMNSFSECGPCASHTACANCLEPYNEGDLIIQCIQCERWLHGLCDSIKTEADAEKCAEEGYNCVLCRPRDVPPPHLLPKTPVKPPTPTKSPEMKSNSSFCIDGVFLSERGHSVIKAQVIEQAVPKKKRRKIASSLHDKEAGIMATIESVVAGSSGDVEESAKLQMVDIKEEAQEIYKEGMLWTKEDGPPPEGFTVYTMESGVSVLRRKRQRNLQKLGIGGFLVRVRGINKSGQDNDDVDMLPGQSTTTTAESQPPIAVEGEKPRRKPVRRKPRSKLAESFPPYLQEAFFGRELLDSHKEANSSSSDEESSKTPSDRDKTIQLSQDEIKAVAAVTAKREKAESGDLKGRNVGEMKKELLVAKEEEESDTEALKDVLALPGDLLDTELVNTIMNEDDDELTKNTDTLESLADSNLPDDPSEPLGNSNNVKETKDELSDILGTHFNLESIPNINSKDVEDIFKGVLTDESQESQESNTFPIQTGNVFSSGAVQNVQHPVSAAIRPTTLATVNQSNIHSPSSFPPQSPYHSEYSNSPQFSPAFSEPPSPWVSVTDAGDLDSAGAMVPSTYNQRSSEKMKADEGLGNGATISAVLYANLNHPEWKTEFPSWNDRYKQILKKWRTLSSEQKAPFLQKARDNRSALRMKKQQQSQISKDGGSPGPAQKPSPPAVPAAVPAAPPAVRAVQHPSAVVSEDQEKIALQQKSAREAEQERQWKQLQALRQQQAQQQQHVIHEQRVQAIAQVQRQITDNGQGLMRDQPLNVQVTTSQEPSPVASPSAPPQRSPFLPSGLKSPPFAHPPAPAIRPTTPSQSPLEASAIASPALDHVKPKEPMDPYAQPPGTPRPDPPTFPQSRQLVGTRINLQRPDGVDINTHLRDLLQKQQRHQQFQKVDNQLMPGKGHQRIWPPNDAEPEQAVSSAGGGGDATFRQPLPPSISRPRAPVPQVGIRQTGIRMQAGDARLQGLDPRLRLLFQQQRGVAAANPQQHFLFGSTLRLSQPSGVRPPNAEQFEEILHRQQAANQFQNRAEHLNQPRLQLNPQLHRPQVLEQKTVTASGSEGGSNEQEIPDNVTAELEKLEEETGTMAELQGVGDILGGLGDEDDDILAEMGADFNILEYADPELDALAGDKANILLDNLDLVEPEPEKDDKKETKLGNVQKVVGPPATVTAELLKKKEALAQNVVTSQPLNLPPPPPLAVSQSQNPVQNNQPQLTGPQQIALHQQIYQQMLQQVQQAAASGRPMAPGTRLLSPDGIVGIVTPNNSISLTLPSNYQQRVIGAQLQLQNSKIQMRLGQTSRIVSVGSVGLHGSSVGMGVPPRLNTPAPQQPAPPPPPPPPPYPGPPPPYPGSAVQQQHQMGLHMGHSPMGSYHLPLGLMHPMRPQGYHQVSHMQRRPLLLEEQPLLLEDLLEQEKREQEKQMHSQPNLQSQEETAPPSSNSETDNSLLSDHDFEKLKVDVFNSGQMGNLSGTPQQAPMLPTSIANHNRANFMNRLASANVGSQWQSNPPPRPSPSQTPVQAPPPEVAPRVPTFTANLLPAPPLPPEHIATDQDKQTQLVYEQWLKHQNNALSQQQQFYETEVQKLRKIRKSLNSKQRQLRKSGNQLTDTDALELQRISTEQAVLQKHLESSRKQSRQHNMLIQEYKNKQQNKQQQHHRQGHSPLLQQQMHSPLAQQHHHPPSSPIHTPQSPMMSPTASSSPMTQHSSPLNSPGPMVTHSPGSAVAGLMQSPGNPMIMSPVQPSPRIGTPHSQGSPSPGPVQSPSGQVVVCPPPPAPRMTSPQHRRVVTSPVGYGGDMRSAAGMQGLSQIRFARPPSDPSSPSILQQRIRLSSPGQNFQQKSNTPSPLNSPPPQHMTTQQLMQKHIQQTFAAQHQALDNESAVNSQRTVQLIQHRQLILRQQQLAQQQQQQQNNQQQLTQQQQHQLLLQQQLLKQQQLNQMQAQNRQNTSTANSPLPPKSPLISQVQNIMSPHSIQPPSPMPPRSPMIFSNQPPSSPMPRSPAVQQSNQPPSSPMMHQHPPNSPMPRSPMIGGGGPISSPMRRPPSTNSSPAMPDRPTSVENPGTPRSMYGGQDGGDHGGGNPHNPCNPLPFPPGLRYGYVKLGLRGGSPMWSLGRGAKVIPTSEPKEDESCPQPKVKKEPHLNKVSILRKRSPIKPNHHPYAGSLVSTDYNEFDDSSSSPPVISSPVPSTSKLVVQKHIEKKLTLAGEVDQHHSPENKQVHEEMMDYDDDNDNNLVSTEVSLSSAAQQNDGDDITVIETFSGDLTDVMSSPLESDQIAEEFVLFQGNMVVDMSSEAQYSDKEEDDEEYGGELVDIDKDMHIVNVAIQSPTTSEEELIMQGKTKKVTSDGLTLNIIQGLSSNHLLTMSDTPESPDQDDLHVDPSPESVEEELLTNFEDSEIVIIDPSVKSPDEQISTKEDFEELIDEGVKKEKIIKSDTLTAKHITEMHKYTSNIGNYQQQKVVVTSVAESSSTKPPVNQKISLISSPIRNISTTKVTEVINRGAKIISTSSAIILPLKTSVRSNTISLPKLVNSVSPAITFVSASTSQMASILPSHVTVPVISASAVNKLQNIKVINKPSSSLSLTTHESLPQKIFEGESSPDSTAAIDEKPAEQAKKEEAEDKMDQEQPRDDPEKTSEKVDEQLKLTKQSMLIHNTPELKMTAQVIREPQSGLQITARSSDGSSTFITQTTDESGSNDLDNKSVVISIPSPTPSQEQMLDNIALQALEHRRRDGNSLPGEFESFEDVLDMIENITGEPPTVLEDNIKDKLKIEETVVEEKETEKKQTPISVVTTSSASAAAAAISNTPNITAPAVSQLSPLSQPAELTTNMANVSQQLRTLLSTSSSNVDAVKKEKVTISMHPAPTTPSHTISRIVPTVSTVIVPNFKQKSPVIVSSSVAQSVSVSAPPMTTATSTVSVLPPPNVVVTSFQSVLPSRSVGSIQLLPDHPKLSSAKPSVIASTITATSSPTSSLGTKSLSLNAMLQSHPAATTPQTSPSTITAASLLGSPIGISRGNFGTSLTSAHLMSPITTTLQTTSSMSFSAVVASLSSTNVKPIVSTTNLLHTQLMKPVKPVLSEEHSGEPPKAEVSKPDVPDVALTHPASGFARDINVGCKISTITTSAGSRLEDSQNVLLKQLLQNTGCASTSPASTGTSTLTTTSTLPATTSSLPLVPNLEAQLARPVPPTPTSLLPPILQNEPPVPKSVPQRTTIMTRETSFVSKPVIQQTSPTITPTSVQLHIDTKKCLPPSRTPSRDDLLSPPTPRSSGSQDSNLQTPPLMIKKELVSTPSVILPQDVKKELVDESSQHSEVSDHSRPDIQMKEEMMDLDPVSEKSLLDQKEELKKMKRRAYQQKRRQNQIMGKETGGQPKKRPRKSSKVDEDYESYIDGVLSQLRSLPPMTVSEPVLNRNFSVVPIFGSGDLSKIGSKDYDTRFGDLIGEYGNAVLPDVSDFYNSKPYGDLEPVPEKSTPSTQRGFYDQEFPLIKFDTDEDKKFDLFSREDTPDSIISSSSPECVYFEPVNKFLGLKLISDGEEDDDDGIDKSRLSPVVPLIAPIPIRLKSSGPYLKDYSEAESNKENLEIEQLIKPKAEPKPTVPLKDSGNVTVTLTLTSSAAEDIMGVLRNLANILHIPAPTSYQIVERTSTPPSQKLGLYRTKGKDGKEGAPIDIQSILNGAAKFCRHCDVVILNNMIRKKVSDLPCLSKETDLLYEDEDLFFCSSTCFMQFALMHKSPSITEDKAAAIINHLCQKEKNEDFRKYNLPSDTLCGFDPKKLDPANLDAKVFRKEYKMEPMDFKFEKHLMRDDYSKLKRPFDKPTAPMKTHRGTHYKIYTLGCVQAAQKVKRPTDKEIMELLYQLNITLRTSRPLEDTRKCMFCHLYGDGVADGPARLLNFDVDKWVHLNCGLWSDGVYETVNGALMNLENALQQSLVSTCVHCNQQGATIRCFKTRCSNIYHLGCAVKDNCVFYKNKTTYCSLHVCKGEKDNELTTLAVSRRVYVNRDENRQVAAVMHHASDTSNLLRVGSLIFLSVGQLLPHQLQNFHTSNYIYPIGYKIIRFYWSMRRLNKRCRYICSIHEVSGRPEFRVLVQENDYEDLELRDSSPKGVWNKILEPLAAMRRENQCLQVFPQFVSGEDLFGLTEPAVVRVLESLPGIETLTDYKFKYGRNPLLELPLAINPSGAARTEPRLRNLLHWKRPHTQRTGSSARPVFATSVAGVAGEVACPYSKQFVHSKSSQYKKMKQEWRNNVYLARSKIQGLGLYAARDLEKHTMVIEYIGEIIRTELAETREKKYEAKNRGIYMFRLDEERVVDATLSGGLARYINHSCNPNCVAEIVEVDRDLRIIIFAKRRIQRGEELAYDYKFDIEDDQHKISCMCGAPNCRKWMN